MPFEQRAPSAVAQLRGASVEPTDVGKSTGCRARDPWERRTHPCQELLDLIRGLSTCRDLTYRASGMWLRIARVALVDERVVRSCSTSVGH